MLTPQSELKRLADSINRLTDSFESSGEEDIFTCVNRIDAKTQEISSRMDMLQDQMSLIIKLLSKQNGV